ncbi:hypothetical protein BDW60DRAFT_193151, partial [Aspergillus nidulans var. acristatus]
MSHMRQVSAALRSILISQLISSMKAAELPENNPNPTRPGPCSCRNAYDLSRCPMAVVKPLSSRASKQCTADGVWMKGKLDPFS